MILMSLPIQPPVRHLTHANLVQPGSASSVGASDHVDSLHAYRGQLRCGDPFRRADIERNSFDWSQISGHWSNIHEPRSSNTPSHDIAQATPNEDSRGSSRKAHAAVAPRQPTNLSMWRRSGSGKKDDEIKRQSPRNSRQLTRTSERSAQVQQRQEQQILDENDSRRPRQRSSDPLQPSHVGRQSPQSTASSRTLNPETHQAHQQPLQQSQTERLQGSIQRVVAGELSADAKEAVKTTRMAKPHVHNACSNCKKAHLSCDPSRPCKRCVSSARQDSCRDVEHKKRGRPRLPHVPGAQQPTMVLQSWEARGGQPSTRPGASDAAPGGSGRPQAFRRSSSAQAGAAASDWARSSGSLGLGASQDALYSRPGSTSSASIHSSAPSSYATPILPPLRTVEPPTSASMDSSRTLYPSTPTLAYQSDPAANSYSRGTYSRSYRELTASSSSHSPFGSFGEIASSLPATSHPYGNPTRTAHEPIAYQTRSNAEQQLRYDYGTGASVAGPPSSWHPRGSFAVSPRSVPSGTHPDALPALQMPPSNQQPLPTLQPNPNISRSSSQLQSGSLQEGSAGQYLRRNVSSSTEDERRKKRRFGP